METGPLEYQGKSSTNRWTRGAGYSGATCLAEQFSRGGVPPSNPRALACLVSRASELAYLLISLIKLSPPPPPSVQGP
jgi:hypothetical protein